MSAGFLRQPGMTQAQLHKLAVTIQMVMSPDTDMDEIESVGKEFGWDDEYIQTVACQHALSKPFIQWRE
jgi:hypothetical protein